MFRNYASLTRNDGRWLNLWAAFDVTGDYLGSFTLDQLRDKAQEAGKWISAVQYRRAGQRLDENALAQTFNGLPKGSTIFDFTGFRVSPVRDMGGCISPFNAFQLIQGVETLSLRCKAHCENANALALWLDSHEKVKKGSVMSPSLPSHPSHELAKKYFRPGCFGSVFIFELNGEGEEAVARADRALGEYSVAGIRHNLNFLRWVLASAPFSEGRYDTGILEKLGPYSPAEISKEAKARLIAAACVAHMARESESSGTDQKTGSSVEPSVWRRAFAKGGSA